MVFSSAFSRNNVHHFLDDCGGSLVIAVRRFSVLEVGVAVLRGTLLNGVLGVQRAGLEVCNVARNFRLVADSADFRVIVGFVPNVYFGNLVAGSEAVEEVDKGHLRFQRGQMRNKRQIHNLLNGAVAKHCKARLAACHNVGMVAENVKRMSRQRARRNVHNHGQQLARNFIHIGNHQQQTLRSGVGACQCARAERAVHSARRAALGLHFCNSYLLTPHVGSARGSPFVRNLRHRGRGGNGVNCGYLREGVRNMACGGITVDSQFFH